MCLLFCNCVLSIDLYWVQYNNQLIIWFLLHMTTSAHIYYWIEYKYWSIIVYDWDDLLKPYWNETFMKQFISQCPESFHGIIVMHCRNLVNRVQIAHVKQPIAHVNDIFPIGNFTLDIKCMNCIQSLWRLMYFKCFDTSGNIWDIYRTKHWSSCVICAISYILHIILHSLILYLSVRLSVPWSHCTLPY